MIDINKAEKEFINYTSQFGNANEKIVYKIQHTKRVENFAKNIAENLKFDEENIKLAILIGILHDIGRFEQVKMYDSYYDNKVDHADLGVKILFENNMIRKFIDIDNYDNIIYKAVKNHNKYKIENNLNAEETLHTKVIRDADKIDILNEISKKTFKSIYNKDEISNQNLSDEVYESIMNRKLVNNNDVKTDLDHWILKVGYIFDINFKVSKQMIKDNQSVLKFIDRINTDNEDTNNKLQSIRKLVIAYLND